MNAKHFQTGYLGLVVLVLLVGCSGGDVSPTLNIEPVQPFPPVATSEPVTTHGVITGLGSVTVNDVRYATGGAVITIDGEPGTLVGLERGQIVTLSGEIAGAGNSGTASTIRFDANVAGPIESLDGPAGRLVVMGQTVHTGPDTLFGTAIDPSTFAGLAAGTTIRVSGFADAQGDLHATWLAATSDMDRQLIGKVRDHDIANLLFRIGRLTVDYSGALVIDLTGGAPADGMMVKVVGTLVDSILKAERLVTAPAVAGTPGRRVQVAGMITRFVSPTDFALNDIAAATRAGTGFVNGLAADLGVNTEIVVDGEFGGDGSLLADRITFGRVADPTVTATFDVADFDEVAVSSVFHVTIEQGPTYSVAVTADEEVMQNVNVTTSGDRLNITLLMGDNNADTLEAMVTMPVLNRIDLSGVVSVRLDGFAQSHLMADVAGVSRLTGHDLDIDSLSAIISGVSQLDFANIRPLGSADIHVSGVSTATVNMDEGSVLTGSVTTGQGTGTSGLFYYGSDAVVDVQTDGHSSVVRLGDTRP